MHTSIKGDFAQTTSIANPMKKRIINRLLHEKKKEETITMKHKKWIRELEALRKDYAKQQEIIQKEAKDRKQKFMDKCAILRYSIRHNDGSLDNIKSFSEIHNKEDINDSCTSDNHNISIPSPDDSSQNNINNDQDQSSMNDSINKEFDDISSIFISQKLEEDSKTDELLEFVSGLDFETYIQDLEVRAALSTVQHRIKDLQKNQNESIKTSKDILNPSLSKNHLHDSNSTTKTHGSSQPTLEQPDFDTSISTINPTTNPHPLARKILYNDSSSSSDLRHIHSIKSLSSILKQQEIN